VANRPELEARLAANKARLRRGEAVARLHSLGVLVAGIADRFALHWHDDVCAGLLAWANDTLPFHGPYDDRQPFDRGAEQGLADILARLVARHALTGWAEILGGFDTHDLAIAIETPTIAALVPKLRAEDPGAFEDVVIASRSRAWAMMVHHEGEVFYWAFG